MNFDVDTEFKNSLREIMVEEQQKILIQFSEAFQCSAEDEDLSQVTVTNCLKDGQQADTLTCLALVAACVEKKIDDQGKFTDHQGRPWVIKNEDLHCYLFEAQEECGTAANDGTFEVLREAWENICKPEILRPAHILMVIFGSL